MSKKKSEKFNLKKFVKDNLVWGVIGFFIILIGVLIYLNQSPSSSNPEDIYSQNSNKVYGDDVIVMYYFHWTRCPHCIEQNKFNKKLLEMYPNLKIEAFEITDSKTKDIYEKLAKNYSKLPNSWSDFPGTPTTIIGDFVNIGFGNEETTGAKLIEIIEKEQKRINENWDDKSMKRTVDLN